MAEVLDIAEAAPKTPGARPKRPNASLVAMSVPLVLFLLVGLFGTWLPLPDPSAQALGSRQVPPFWAAEGSLTHVLGTDQLGRDMLARLVAGARLTALIAVSAMLVGGALGTLVGLVAGYRRGWVDTLLSRVIDAQLAIPFVLLAMAVIVSAGRSLAVLIGVLAIFSWAQYARVIRAEALAMRERPFVLALRAGGLPGRRIVLRHILPNISGTVLVLATLEIGTMILGESALSFLGIGVSAPDVSWGAMLAEGRGHLRDAWWIATFPGIAITIVVVLINLLGDELRTRYDPRKRSYGAE